MSTDTVTMGKPPQHLDYSLVGEEASRAIERGLAEADWYQCPVPRATLRKLLERKDGPAIRDTIVLSLILLATGWATAVLWGTWWAVLPYFVYATFYGTSSDSRWHECGHGTAFKTDWMNRLVYEIASFMVMRESVVWRWSHTRHHSDTIIVGRDPEIQVPRPPDMLAHVLSLMNVGGYRTFFPKLFMHAAGRISDEEKTFIPQSEFPKVIRNARVYMAIYVLVIAAVFRHLADDHPQHAAARGPGGKRARPPPQLPHGVHESNQPVHLLEHELSCGAPHVSLGAVSRVAKAA
jgi:fatty acid desaturase